MQNFEVKQMKDTQMNGQDAQMQAWNTRVMLSLLELIVMITANEAKDDRVHRSKLRFFICGYEWGFFLLVLLNLDLWI